MRIEKMLFIFVFDKIRFFSSFFCPIVVSKMRISLQKKRSLLMYQRMYYVMIHASERAIEALDVGNTALAREILINAEQQAEGLFCR